MVKLGHTVYATHATNPQMMNRIRNVFTGRPMAIGAFIHSSSTADAVPQTPAMAARTAIAHGGGGVANIAITAPTPVESEPMPHANFLPLDIHRDCTSAEWWC